MVNLKTNGVSINGKHSYNDFGLVMTSKTISAPEPQKNIVSVPGRNGAIDMSEVLTGNVRYNNRKITMVFVAEKKPLEWALFQSELQNAYQGQKAQIIFDDDVAFYWTGRTELSVDTTGYYFKVTVTADVDPYKYSIATSVDDWLWDPFDFDQSLINEASNIDVDGSYELTLICSERWENPVIVSDSDMTVEFDDETYDIEEGSQVMYDIILTPGENVLTFTGDGTVSVIYCGGSF